MAFRFRPFIPFAILLLVGVVDVYGFGDVNGTFHFREDGTFKIVQFTDLHFESNTTEKDVKSCEMMDKVLTEEKPDLVVFTGDQVTGHVCKHNPGGCGAAWAHAISTTVLHKIPYLFIFGNHDAAGDLTKEELLSLDHSLSPYSFTEAGPTDIHGYCNYYKPIYGYKSEKMMANLWFLDSGSKDHDYNTGGYDWIRANQVEWYKRTSEELKMKAGGVPIPSMMFFHIPIPEYNQIYFCNKTWGNRGDVDLGTGFMNAGLYENMLEMGDVFAVTVGHAHQNDYHGLNYDGKIHLYCGRSTGFSGYGELMKGVRMFELRLTERTVKTWMRLADGSVVYDQTEHDPEKGRCYFTPYTDSITARGYPAGL